MKKYFFIIFLFIIWFSLSSLHVSAIDMCGQRGDPSALEKYSEKVGFKWEITQWVNIRDYPCANNTTVLGTAKTWEQYNTTHKLHWWYGVTLENGQTGWIWDQAIKNTGKNITVTEKKYSLSSQDQVLVSKINKKIEAIIEIKWASIKNILLVKLRQVLSKTKTNTRMNLIIQALIDNTANIEILQVEVIAEEKPTPNPSLVRRGEESETIETTSNNQISIDESKVRQNWIGWYNSYRQSLWLHNYSYSSKLDITSLDWSQVAKTRWEISHRRDTWDSYYDYTKIESWLKDRGVSCKNVSRATYTENIWWGTFSCSDGDCTEELSNGIKKTYDFFLSEKDDDYQPNYKAIVHPYFKKVWLGIVVTETKKDYYNFYLTTHFCTEVQ